MNAKYVVLYTTADDVAEKAPLHYAEHWEWAQQFVARGSLLLIGPFGDPQAEGSMAVFASREDAEEFVEGDPFRHHGVVAGHEIRRWDEALLGQPA